jgi:acetyltransferase
MTPRDSAPFPLGSGRITIATKGGREVCVRHILARDAALLVDLFNRLSSESRRMRFFTTRPDIPEGVIPPEMVRLADIDPLTHAALIATVSEDDVEHAVAVARVVASPNEPSNAEMAIVVRDDYQGEGLGSVLFDLIVQVALVRGLQRLWAISLAENDAFHRLVRRAGLPFVSERNGSEIVTTIMLTDEAT